MAVSKAAIGLGMLASLLKNQPPPVETDTTEAWRKGDLSYKLRPIQKEMAQTLDNAGAMKKVLNCSRRIGKTFLACVKSIETCIKEPGCQIRFGAPTQKALRKIVHPIIREISRDAPPELKPIWRSQDGFYLVPGTGAEIHCSGCNSGHEENLRGTAARRCIVEEAGQVRDLRYVVEDILMPQLLTTGGDLWLISTPPRTPAHDFTTYAQDAQLKGAYAEYPIHKSGYDPAIIEKFCQEAGGEKSATWLREYLCQFVVDPDFHVVPEWRDDFVREYVRDEFFRFYYTYAAMDIGGRDFTVVVFGVYDFKRATLFVEDEVVMRGPEMTTEKLAAAIKAKEADLWGTKAVHGRVADNNNLILLQDLGHMHKMHFSPTSKDTLEAMVNQLRVWVARGRVVCHPRCIQTIGCLKYAIWNERRKEFDRSAVYGHFDALAALIYLVRYVDEKSNPIPPTYGTDPRNMIIPPQITNTKQNEAIMGLFGGKKRGL